MERGDKIAAAATAHAGSSSVLQPQVYLDLVRRPADCSPMLDQFYLHNKLMSSCGLAALGAIRIAGCTEPECTAPYFPGHGQPERDAVADVQTLARRFSAWVSASMPMPLPQKGDVWIIADEHGGDAHVGTCISDASPGSSQDVNAPAATFVIATVEGGQYSGSDSSAIESFSRTFHLTSNRWMLGNRYLLGYASAAKLPIPETADDPAVAIGPANAETDPHT